MSEERKGSLLLPLGIGAGLLLLLTSMKKKETAPALPAAKADDSAALPEINPGEAAAPQITPKPAPSYAQAVAQAAVPQTREDEDTEDLPDTDNEKSTNDDPPSPDQSLQPDEPDNDEPNEDEPEEEESNSGPAYTKSHSPGPAKASVLVDAAKMLIRPGAAKPMRRKTTKKPIRPIVQATRVPVPPAVVAAQPEIRIASRPAAALPAAAATRPGTIFPLKPGVTGNVYVKEIQKRLGVPVTGNFGVQTKAALMKRFRVQEVSEALYKQIITGKIPAAPVKRVPVRKGPARPAVNRTARPVARKGKAVRKRK